MPNFAMHIQGEPEPRGFQYDVEEQALYTDVDTENALGGMKDQKRLKITESNAQHDPQRLMYWEQTAVYRNAYHLCEDQGISFEEAFERSALEFDQPALIQKQEDPVPPSQRSFDPPDTEESSEPEPSNTVAGIVITNQQLIMGVLTIIAERPEDLEAELIAYCKTEMEKINDYEVII